MPDFFDGICSLWPGADLGGRMRGMHPPISAIFKNVFDVHNFSMILNLVDTLSIIDNVRTKCIIFGEALKKFKQNLRENYSKSSKTAITVSELFSREKKCA